MYHLEYENKQNLFLSLKELKTYRKPVFIKNTYDNCIITYNNSWGVVDFDNNLWSSVEILWFGSEVPDHPDEKDYGVKWFAYKDEC